MRDRLPLHEDPTSCGVVDQSRGTWTYRWHFCLSNNSSSHPVCGEPEVETTIRHSLGGQRSTLALKGTKQSQEGTGQRGDNACNSRAAKHLFHRRALGIQRILNRYTQCSLSRYRRHPLLRLTLFNQLDLRLPRHVVEYNPSTILLPKSKAHFSTIILVNPYLWD